MRKTIFFALILFFFTGFIMQNNQQEYHPSKGEQLVNITLASTAKIIKDKYNVYPCGSGAAMPGGPVQEVTLCFETKCPYTKEQLRELLIISSQELLKQVNENIEIQKFLKEKPFTIKNVGIIIYNHSKDGRGLIDPEISVARISEGNIIYRTNDPQDSFRYKNEFKESYEEALKVISKT